VEIRKAVGWFKGKNKRGGFGRNIYVIETLGPEEGVGERG